MSKAGKLITTPELAKMLGVGRRRALQRAAEANIKPAKVYGRSHLWRATDVRKMGK